MRINPELPEDQQRRLRDLIVEFSFLFVQKDELPPPIAGEPYCIELKPGAKPYFCSQPHWTPAKKKFLTNYFREQLRKGLYERVMDGKTGNCAWANRPHLAFKEGPPGEERTRFKIRPVGDFVEANKRFVKIAPSVPLLRVQTEKFSDCIYFLEADGASAYHLVELDEKSRNYLALRTPIGLLRPTRLVEGQMNAGSVFQEKMTKTLSKLPDASLSQVCNYMDDINGGATDFESFCSVVRDLFMVLAEDNYTLNPKKMKLGYPTASFGGFEVGRGQRRLAEKHMAPLLNLREPRNVSELRSVMGTFVQLKAFIKDYAIHAKPLYELLGKIPWDFNATRSRAYEFLKAACCAWPTLANPDFMRLLFLDTDASEAGYGFQLYHRTDVDRSQPLEQPPLPSTECKEIIMYGSKAWTTRETRLPVYYKEAFAMFYGLRKCRYYVESSPYETAVYTDHAPLRWIKHSTSDRLTSWTLEEFAGLTYRIEYILGVRNGGSDAMSREPVITQRPLQRVGYVKMINDLLGHLVSLLPSAKSCRRLWFWCGPDTTDGARLVQRWRTLRNPVMVNSPNASAMSQDWDFAILMPSGGVAPTLCAQLFGTLKSFACLVPSDLVNWIAVTATASRDEQLSQLVSQARKIVYLDTSLTWVVHGCSDGAQNLVLSTFIESKGATTEPEVESTAAVHVDTDGITTHTSVGDVHTDWVREQALEKDELLQGLDGEVVTLESGLMLLVTGDSARVLVPNGRREALIRRAHETTQHQSWKKVLKSLERTYYWRGMSSQVRRVVAECHSCAVVKPRRNVAHGQFASINYSGPRVAYAIDFYGVAESDAGFKWILTVIDLFGREIRFLPTKTRSAREVVEVILREIININGVPAYLVSDDAKEFLGKIVQGFADALGIKRITTKPYNARGNAICEAAHRFLGQCLTRLSVDERKVWEKFCNEFSFAHNTAYHATLGCTPFEVGHGAPAMTLTSSLVYDADDAGDDVRGYYGRLRLSADTYRDIAAKCMLDAQNEQNARLNRGGRPRIYSLGDRVSIFFPSHATGSDWKAKHKLSWRGPMRIVEATSNTAYVVEDEETGRRYERTVTNVAPYRPTSAVPRDGFKHEQDRVQIGDMVAVKDDSASDEVWIARVLGVDADTVECHYWSTTSSSNNAVFKPTYVGLSSGKTILTYRLRANEEPTKLWTGTSPLELVVAKVGFRVDKRGQHRLDHASLRSLRDYRIPRMR